METILVGIAMAVAGVVVGIFSGMLGIGGGTVMVPMLRLVFGCSAIVSTATSLFVIVPTSISGAVSHIRNHTCIIKLGLALGIGGAISSSLGVFLADHSPSLLIMVVAALIIGYSAYNMLRKALRMGAKKPAPEALVIVKDTANPDAAQAGEACATKVSTQKASAQELAPAKTYDTKRDLACGFGIGLIAGLASGYVGVGGGFIMVPLMTSWLDVPMHKATGTSLVAILILAIPGVVEYLMLGHVDLLAGIMLAIGSIPGAVVGTKISEHIPERELRFVFAAFLAVAAILLLVKETGLLG